MTVSIRIPKLGLSMDEGFIVEWLVDDGEEIAAGAPLYTLGTDKVENEVEAPVAGRIRLIGVPDSPYPVGTVIAEIDEL